MFRARTLAVATALSLLLNSGVIATAAADPPPWAKAHGHHSKHEKKHKHKHGHHEATPVYLAPFGIAQGTCFREVLGGVVGGAVGAAAGSQVGKGSGRTIAVIGGTIIGALLGGAIGRSMDQTDQRCVGQVLEHAESNQPIVWVNHDNQSRYSIVPERTFQADGAYCREYTATATVAGQSQQTVGTACRQPDGTWKLMN